MLLYRMLPPIVVAQIKQGFHVADEHADIFILASDICGFTKLSAATEPSEVMHLLSELFSGFDELSEAMGVYKAITIGDAYIAVTGMFNAQVRMAPCAVAWFDWCWHWPPLPHPCASPSTSHLADPGRGRGRDPRHDD